MTEPKPQTSATYHGNCHCGAARFTATISPPLEHRSDICVCNCSICARNGHMLVFVPPSDLVFSQGQDELKSYAFGKRNLRYYFCGVCGSSVYGAASEEMIAKKPEMNLRAVNVRMLKDVDLDGLQVKKVDGKSLDPPYHL